VYHERAPTVCCWECETETDAPRTVVLRTRVGPIARLALCPACYHACYLPLARDGSEVLDVAPDQSHVRPRYPR
jgi:hypothetical protein